ncbi:glycerol-3-phosphate dehydrogenase/oxidase [Stackebrandtia nassauensis]|uniref:Glycerol-3-phosphate dehydrogenase n=1 Tax=Stackebrandtia nassauensis (strain DSM 44728 / CIP 108903 / NRRL B-16338 / NBRC 102104 / LLR-40K-21) TaxID=446470 RepID=D3Q0W7_STANL|nr:glycerol-3-phosphate dehydrogenase/oxidase [Stackebrandtia nassauensis]ADD43717.1 FAD dependent oxidoreductase [Stackebrandtia nassauensis DSM 44728]
MSARNRFDPRRRADTIAELSDREFDLIVIGGGITGVGTALDAVSRGLSVALLEAGDLAAGTSSRSGKVFHGGLRYLQQLNFSLVREALKERDLMVDRLCPHLVSPELFTFPFTRRWQRPYVGAGVLLYDLLRLTGTRSVGGHRHLSRKGVLRKLPGLKPKPLTGGVSYYDVRVDDARHTMTVARTAAGLGARIVTRAEVTGIVRDGETVIGVVVRDKENDTEFTVRGRSVVSATGVWAEGVQALAGESSIAVTAAKGIHLVVPADRIDADSGLIAQTDDSVFIIRRWFDYWLMGTTDTAWDHERDDPAATGADVDYLLAQANRWLKRPLSREDVVGVYAGLRPLVSGRKGATAALSRDHTVMAGPRGMFTVVGGKYTTYRIMARDAVNAAVGHLGSDTPDSATDKLPILGADGYRALRNQRLALAAEAGLDPEWIDHLLGRYGTLVLDLLELMAERPELAKPVEGAPKYLAAELYYAASHEGALHLDDVLVRRTRIFMETPDHGEAAAVHAAAIVGEVLGWDERRQADEVERYRLEREADRRAVDALTDDDAMTARRSARAEAKPRT